jgi:hypothetical protein
MLVANFNCVVVEGSRSILFDLHSRIGLDFGILIAWGAVNTLFFPICCWFMSEFLLHIQAALYTNIEQDGKPNITSMNIGLLTRVEALVSSKPRHLRNVLAVVTIDPNIHIIILILMFALCILKLLLVSTHHCCKRKSVI